MRFDCPWPNRLLALLLPEFFEDFPAAFLQDLVCHFIGGLHGLIDRTGILFIDRYRGIEITKDGMNMHSFVFYTAVDAQRDAAPPVQAGQNPPFRFYGEPSVAIIEF